MKKFEEIKTGKTGNQNFPAYRYSIVLNDGSSDIEFLSKREVKAWIKENGSNRIHEIGKMSESYFYSNDGAFDNVTSEFTK